MTGRSASGYTLGAATRLQDFRALIGDLKAMLLHRDSKEKFDTGHCAAADDDKERERLHQFLEDVIRKVLWHPPWRPWLSVAMKYSQVPI